MPYTKYLDGEARTTTFGGLTDSTTSYRVPGYSQNDQGDVDYNVDWWYISVFYLQYLCMLLFNFAGLYGALYQSYNMAGKSDSRKLTMTLAVWTSHQHATKGQKPCTIQQRRLTNKFMSIYHEGLAIEADQDRDWNLTYFKRGTSITTSLTIAGLAVWWIMWTVETYAVSSDALEQLLPAIVVVIVNGVLPTMFDMFAEVEQWGSRGTREASTVLRSILTRLAAFYAFFYTTFFTAYDSHSVMCWESAIGQAAYNVFVTGTIAELASSAAADAGLKYSPQLPKIGWIVRMFGLDGKPTFYFLKHTVELLYTNLIIMFGTPYCPILPFVGIGRFIALFYVKAWSTRKFCTPADKAFFFTGGLKTAVWGMLLMCSLFPVPFHIRLVSTATSSGAYMSDTANGVNGYELRHMIKRGGGNVTNANMLPFPTTAADLGDCRIANTNDAAATCKLCLSEARDLTKTYCVVYNGEVYTPTLADYCAACPSGCGPFRNRPTAYAVVTTYTSSWSSGTIGDYLGTKTLAGIIIMISWLFISLQSARASAYKKRVTKLSNELKVCQDQLKSQVDLVLHHKDIILNSSSSLGGRGIKKAGSWDLAAKKAILNKMINETLHGELSLGDAGPTRRRSSQWSSVSATSTSPSLVRATSNGVGAAVLSTTI